MNTENSYYFPIRTNEFTPPPGIGLTLGSGAARGFAHIGVLKILEREGIYISALSGCSAGAFFAAAYAARPNAKELEEFCLSVDWKKFFTYNPLKISATGVIIASRVEEFLEEVFQGCELDKLTKPVALAVTNYLTGEGINLTNGSVAKAVRGSMSLPVFITPYLSENGEIHVDGGLTNPLPVDVLEDLELPLVLAVDITSALNVPQNTLVQRVKSLKESLDSRNASFHASPPIQTSDDKVSTFMANWLQRAKQTATEEGSHWVENWLEHNDNPPVPGKVEVFFNSMSIVERQLVRHRVANSPKTMVITPALADVRLLDVAKMTHCIEAGEAAAEAALPQIEKALARFPA